MWNKVNRLLSDAAYSPNLRFPDLPVYDSSIWFAAEGVAGYLVCVAGIPTQCLHMQILMLKLLNATFYVFSSV